MWRRSSTHVWTCSVRFTSISRARPPTALSTARIPQLTKTPTFWITKRLFSVSSRTTAIGPTKPELTNTLNTNSKEDMGAKGTHTVDTTQRLKDIRKLLQESDGGLDAFVVPSEDQRMSCFLSLGRRWSPD